LPKTRKIEGYTCKKYEAKYTTTIEKQTKLMQNYDFKSFSDYFNSATTNLQNNQPLIKCPKKDKVISDSYNATVYASEQYPLKYYQFLPILHIVKYVSPHIGKLVEFLVQSKFENLGFPLKISVPVHYTVIANLTLKNLKFVGPDYEFMNIDENYVPLILQDFNNEIGQNNNGIQEILVFSPIKSLSPQKKHSERCEFPQPAEIILENDRLSWTSQDENHEDNSILLAEKQFETLLKKSDSDSQEEIKIIIKNDDEKENKNAECIPTEYYNDIEEFDTNNNQNIIENIYTHYCPNTKTLMQVNSPRKFSVGLNKNPIISSALASPKKLSQFHNSDIKEEQQGNNKKIIKLKSSLTLKEAPKITPKRKSDLEQILKFDLQSRDLIERFRVYLSHENICKTKKIKDVDINLE